jgi:acyl-coenzyme A thioesterase PaaI-like protein
MTNAGMPNDERRVPNPDRIHRAPSVTPPPGCVSLYPFPGPPQSFVSGDPDGHRLRVAYFRRQADGVLFARAWFGRGAEGPPGFAHGGSVAAVLDEAMGAAAWAAGHPSIAARIVVDFKTMVPLGIDASVEMTVEKVEGRKVTTRARLLDADGRVLAQSEGLFVRLTDDQIRDALRLAEGAS